MLTTIREPLEKSFADYEEMQSRHILSYTTDLKPDIGRQTFERDRVFENLKNELTNVLHRINKNNTDENRAAVAFSCKERIQSILDQDKILMERLIQYRESLIRHLGRMEHGKRALKGYTKHVHGDGSYRVMDKAG